VLAGRAVGFYLWKDFWPTKLAMVYGVWPLETSRPVAYLPTIVVAVVVAGLWWQRRKPWARAGLFAATVFLLSLLPILGFLPATFMKSHGSVADHWQYVALVAPVALAVAVGLRGRDRWLPGWAGRMVAAAALILLGTLTFRHAATHRTPKALWTQNLAVADVWDARVGLGRALSEEGNNAAAIGEVKRAIELYPAATPAWIGLGALYTDEKRYDEAHCSGREPAISLLHGSGHEERHRRHEGHILPVVGHGAVRLHVRRGKESEDRQQRQKKHRRGKQPGPGPRLSSLPPQPRDHGCDDDRRQIGNRTRGLEGPHAIHHRKLRRPEILPEIEAHRPAGEHSSPWERGQDRGERP
jgi:hypothetical protein